LQGIPRSALPSEISQPFDQYRPSHRARVYGRFAFRGRIRGRILRIGVTSLPVERPDEFTTCLLILARQRRMGEPFEVVWHEVNALATAAQPGEYEAIDRALYLTAAMTGLRQGELVALRWQDVDWPAARVRVRQNYVLGEFGAPKSKRSTRSVPLADVVAGELDRLFKASSRQGDDDLVFADPHTGGPLDKAAILRRYRRALKAAKLDETHRFHDLRHTFGTRMAAQGVPMRMLQEWMGHRDIQTTQRYADYAPSAHEAAYVEAAFAQESPTADRAEVA
jgi:integrase